MWCVDANFWRNNSFVRAVLWLRMEILGFLGAVAAQGLDPIALAAGIFLGYLFSADWVKLAWGLLLFVIPGIGSLQAPTHGFL